MSEKTPILAPSGGSPALTSQPDTVLEYERYHIDHANPAPWWVSALWLLFFGCAFSNLMVNLLQLG